jgi:hypothetical protein
MATHTTTATRSEIIEALRCVVSTNDGIDAEAFNVDLAADAILAGQVTPDTNDELITDEVEALAYGAFMSNGPWWQAATWTEELVEGRWVACGDYGCAPIPDDDDATIAVGWSAWRTYIGPEWHTAGEAATYRVVWREVGADRGVAAVIEVDGDGNVEVSADRWDNAERAVLRVSVA